MAKSARYHIDRAKSIVFTSERLPLQPVSSERNHQVAVTKKLGKPYNFIVIIIVFSIVIVFTSFGFCTQSPDEIQFRNN